ncbi:MULTISPECIES: phosphotransferase [unclassified Agarivorans]|uniref:phosphotransferase n=1 Tax=unclassified Agarivorans TaxID=2636026 RepID=UPI0026E155F4|nr:MULTISPECIES: phosphotransferase [unclassified Agarivorans]MDO6684597.1 phosphotransferase [Agarivorans sp. 3_MG-2023]MDO6714762.1 phosphotransferase [Agarivorans sp. 2_MG-2023]
MDVTNALGCVLTSTLGELEIVKFLGKGKSGYSYLAQGGEQQYVVKLMHSEPCAYYSFGDANKVELEVAAYQKLASAGIAIPKLLDVNLEGNYLVKDYIDGDLVTDLVINDALPSRCVEQVCDMFKALKPQALNIDYFPDNFVMSNDTLYYVDYEYNPYEEQWDLVNWGLYYWANPKGMKAFKDTKDSSHINVSADSGQPLKQGFTTKVTTWVDAYC